MKTKFLITFFLMTSMHLFAQIDSSNSIANKFVTPTVKDLTPHMQSYFTSEDFWLSIAVLLFSILVFVVELILIIKLKLAGKVIIKLFTVTIIILGTLFIMVSGITSEKIATALGLLGTIGGYVLGQASGNDEK